MAKYPSPSEARSNFETGVEAAREKWVARARAGAVDYETWFTGFANTIYPIVAGLPTREGKTVAQRVTERVIPVAQAISRLSTTYRAAKLKKVVEAVKVVV